LLQQAKLASLEFPSQQSMDGSVTASVEEVGLTRELLEVSITSSVPAGDWHGFELQLAQLLPLYSAGGGGESEATKESRRLVTGLQLMHLLVEARLSDFHCRVETLQEADIAHPLIAFPLKLEATLLEGGYNKVRAVGAPCFFFHTHKNSPYHQHTHTKPAHKSPTLLQVLTLNNSPPHELFKYFLVRLEGTVRDDIADCAAAAYKSLPVGAACKMLRLEGGASALSAYAEGRGLEWVVEGDTLRFAPPESTERRLNAATIMANALGYAAELERVV
jgi:26S proteasome regulatory subunit N12